MATRTLRPTQVLGRTPKTGGFVHAVEQVLGSIRGVLGRTRTTVEFVPPAHAVREMPSPSYFPKDEIAREIVILLMEHPQIAIRFNNVNPNALSLEAKVEMLGNIKTMLGIRPIRRRHLGYVGP